MAYKKINEGSRLIGIGEMGIANTTPSSAIVSVITGTEPIVVTGPGANLPQAKVGHKAKVIKKAIDLNTPNPLDGIDVLADALKARGRIGTLPHGAGLYPHLTARENITYYARLYEMNAATLDESVQKIIDQLEINDFADRRSKGFSQGQRTKVALARSLVHGPQNIILDEPSNGLDVMATRALRDVVRLLKAAGKCVLFSSHVMQEVAALCDEIVIIAEGQVALHDSPDGIRNTTGCDDLEDAFVKAIHTVEPAA